MCEIELVLNVDYGGFRFDTEMALWLSENRGWQIIKNKDYDYKSQYPLTTLIDLGGDYFCSPKDNIQIRSHKDLIDCVRYLQKLHETDEYPESIYGHIHDLEIKKISVEIEIEDYHDGKEKVVCHVKENWD